MLGNNLSPGFVRSLRMDKGLTIVSRIVAIRKIVRR